MHQQMLIAADLLAATVTNSKHFHIGPWIIVPILTSSPSSGPRST
jgi:hypothetical protein